MTTPIESFLLADKEIIEAELRKIFASELVPVKLKESMEYSLFAGGKRLRPILLLASYEAFSKDKQKEKSYKTAMALEMIHTYSLIHDDLPAMDDDDYRRGNITNHKKFDEATAILAGDGLLTHSFALVTGDNLLTPEEKVFIVNLLAQSAGPAGMVGGQILDMEGEQRKLNLEELEEVHKLKTGMLISFAIIVGAYLAGIDEARLNNLKEFAHYLGLIFQVQDDILDLIGDEEKLGKAVGSDLENDKSTYPNLLGLEGAINQKQLYITKAETALEKSKPNTDQLLHLLYHFSERDY